MNNDFESDGEREEREMIAKEDAEGKEKYYLTSGRRVSKWLYAVASFADALAAMREPPEPYYTPSAAPRKHWIM